LQSVCSGNACSNPPFADQTPCSIGWCISGSCQPI
jgi:hypothetical protein